MEALLRFHRLLLSTYETQEISELGTNASEELRKLSSIVLEMPSGGIDFKNVQKILAGPKEATIDTRYLWIPEIQEGQLLKTGTETPKAEA